MQPLPANKPVALPTEPLDERERAFLSQAAGFCRAVPSAARSEEHTSELQSPCNLVCRLLLEKKKHRLVQNPVALNHPTLLIQLVFVAASFSILDHRCYVVRQMAPLRQLVPELDHAVTCCIPP